MKNIRGTSNIVKIILETEPKARNNNDVLYSKVCEHINRETLGVPLHTFLNNRKEFKIPPFESVVRARRKIVKAYPELSADSTVEAYREMNEEIVKNYARSV